MVLLGDVGEVEARFMIVLISMQDSCTICAERAIVSEVMLGAPNGTPRLHRSSGGSLVLTSMQDRCTVCAKCTIGSEISLDAPDGTPR